MYDKNEDSRRAESNGKRLGAATLDCCDPMAWQMSESSREATEDSLADSSGGLIFF